MRDSAVSLDDVLFGCSPLGGVGESLDDDEAEEAVERAVELGFRSFDTAPHYGLGEHINMTYASINRCGGDAARERP